MGARRVAAVLGLAIFSALAATSGSAGASERPAGLDRIKHILVIYLENRSFDNLFGRFPGANGLADAGDAPKQVDRAGKVYPVLPPVIDTLANPPGPDPRFPKDLPNAPFEIDKYVPIDQRTGDLVHRFYQEQAQIDGGRMDKFVAWSDAATLAMGYFDISRTSLWRYAREFALADNFFHAAFGGSFLSHFWLICECAPRYPDAPPSMVVQLDAKGELVRDGEVTPDGYAVNTIFPTYTPHPKVKDPRELLPPQKGIYTIGDQLSERGISWAWYSGGWNQALAGHRVDYFQYHHQPFAYLEQYGDGTAARARHLKDETVMLAEIAKGRLPAVAFWKPVGAENQHPGYAELVKGDRKLDEVIREIRSGPLWRDTLIIVTYDENGGEWDHVPPPRIDKWGPGTRVPAIVVSRFAKRGFVDHTFYDTTSILKLIHERFHLAPLSDREARVGDLTNALDF